MTDPLETQHFERLCALLDTLDQSHAGESGSLAFGDAAHGLVLVQSGRICWAASSMMPTRLTDRLRSAAHAADSELQRVFRECRESGKPFGQTLVERGIVTSSMLRAALLQHNAETLLELAGHPAPQWRPSRVEQYERSLTFTSAELLAHSADGWWGPLAAKAREELHAALRGSEAEGLAFLQVPDSHAIVPAGIVGLDELTARETLALGRAAAGLLRACRAVDGHLVSTTYAGGRTAVVWAGDGAIYIAAGRERSELAFVLAHLSRRPCE